MSWLGWPISLVYGFVRGLSGLPHLLIPEMAGALLARYWLEPRFGAQQWPAIRAGVVSWVCVWDGLGGHVGRGHCVDF